MSYIERKTLLEIAEQQGHVTVDDIINEPAADVAPVRHGPSVMLRAIILMTTAPTAEQEWTVTVMA